MWYTHVRLGYWSWKEDILETNRLDTGIDEWLRMYKRRSVKAATYDRLRVSFDMLMRNRISSVMIADITTEDIQNYMNDLADEGYAITTIKKQFTLITAYLKYEYARGRIQVPVYIGVKLPDERNVQNGSNEGMDVFSPFEQNALKRILTTLKRRPYGAIFLMLELGLRSGEAQSLQWDDILWGKKAIRIHRTFVHLSSEKGISFVQDSAKSKTSNRTVPLTNAAMDILERIRENQNTNSPYVFPSLGDPDMPISYFSVRWSMQQACKEANVDYRSVHTLRHTFATNCYNRGCDVKILSKLLGHADVSITYNIYIHLYGDALEEMRKVIE